jgi:hypothetical protein
VCWIAVHAHHPATQTRFASPFLRAGEPCACPLARAFGLTEGGPLLTQKPWISRVWQEFRAGNLTRAYRDVLLTLASYHACPAIVPSHATLAERCKCSVRTVQRALQAARDLGLVDWAERRIRALWRSLRTSNRYALLVPPEGASGHRTATARTTTGQRDRGEGTESKKGLREVLAKWLQEAAKGPDLLLARRLAWAQGAVRPR